MILKENTDVVETSSTAVGSFSIKASAMAAHILSSKLYSDKILAVIRETASNAWDSQIQAGAKAEDIQIHVPTYFEPYFSVKDTGLGMDKETAAELYTTYFHSTKSQSNQAVGGFGVGSKSPFAYTNNFTIKAIKNGTECVFSAFMSQDAFPQIALLSEEPTGLPNGVEVIVPVETKDIAEFTDKIKSYFRIWNPAPIFNDTEVAEYVAANTLPDSFDTQGYIWQKFQHHMPKLFVKMGKNLLAFEADKVQSKVKNAEQFTSMLRNSVESFGIAVNIGDIDVAVSREHVEYTEKTANVLAARIDQFIEESKTNLETALQAATSVYEAVKLLNLPIAPFMRNFKPDSLAGRFPQCKQELFVGMRHLTDIAGLNARLLTGKVKREYTNSLAIMDSYGSEQCTFYVQDTKSDHQALARMKQAGLNFKYSSRNYLLTPKEYTLLVNTWGFPADKFIFCSSFPEVIKNKNAVKYPKNLYVIKPSGRLDVYTGNSIQSVLDAADNVYYAVSLERKVSFDLDGKKGHMGYDNHSYAGPRVHHLLKQDDIFILVPTSNKACIEDTWIPMNTLLEEAYEEFKPLLDTHIELSHKKNALGGTRKEEYLQYSQMMQPYLQEIQALKDELKDCNIEILDLLLQITGYNVKVETQKIEKAVKAFEAEYPLLSSIYYAGAAGVEEYIKAIDFMKASTVKSTSAQDTLDRHCTNYALAA